MVRIPNCPAQTFHRWCRLIVRRIGSLRRSRRAKLIQIRICRGWLRLERAAKRLVPGLGSGDPDQLILIVAGVEVEVGEKLGLG